MPISSRLCPQRGGAAEDPGRVHRRGIIDKHVPASVPLFDDPFTAVLPPEHPLVGRRPLTLRDLADETWIGGTPTSTWFHIVRRACHAAGVEPHVRFSTDDYVAIQALVAAGLGVAVVPSLAVGPTAHRVHARALPPPAPTRRISVALPPDGHRHSAVQTMIDVLRGAGRNRRIDAASAPDFDR